MYRTTAIGPAATSSMGGMRRLPARKRGFTDGGRSWLVRRLRGTMNQVTHSVMVSRRLAGYEAGCLAGQALAPGGMR